MGVREAELQAAILEYLRLKERFFWRNNSGAFKTERGGFYRIGTPGAPDIIGCFHGKFVALEVKTVTVASFQMTRRRSPLVLFVLATAPPRDLSNVQSPKTISDPTNSAPARRKPQHVVRAKMNMKNIETLERKWELEAELREAEKTLISDEKSLIDAQHYVETSLRSRNEARDKLDASGSNTTCYER